MSTATIAAIEHWATKLQLGASVRAEIYDTLTILLDNNILLVDALAEMYAVASDEGRKPTRPKAAMLYECRQMVAEGKPFAEAIRKWVSREEAALIAAGEKSGNLRGAFTDAMALIATGKKIRAAVFGGVAQPAALFGVLGVLFWIVAHKLVPALESAAPPETWTGAAKLMYLVAMFVTHFGAYSVAALAVVIVATLVSFPRLRGNVRYRLDKLPPWSVYRLITGATFLLNVAVLIRSGVKLHDALVLLSESASPYLRERIDAAILGTTKGRNLGEALEKAEFDFPDREAVKLIRLLANRDGFDRALATYAQAWIDSATKKVQNAMRVFFYVAIIGVGACAAMIVSAGTELQTIIQANAQG